jgi:DNA helicase-2/ATP-dependent DNA helicase PcrA
MTLLQRDFARLDEYQRDAVCHPGNLVVLAGPGSGKTAAVVLKVSYLLREVVSPPRGVACITYSADTAREFSLRLRRYGIRPSDRLFLGTVHSFCLNRVLRPFANLVNRPDLAHPRVLGRAEAQDLLDDCIRDEHLRSSISGFGVQLSIIRKARCCQVDLSRFLPAHLSIAERFEAGLLERKAIDFDGMVIEAVTMVRGASEVRSAIAARFPWILVDEYQDLGGPLHELVRVLTQAGQVRVMAVGDPDQSIFGFAGADPQLIQSLVSGSGFDHLTLPLNYRSPQEIISAGQVALAATPPREYRAASSVEQSGEIFIWRMKGTVEDQAYAVVRRILPDVLAAVAPHQVAVLYPGKGPVLDGVARSLTEQGIPHLLERDERFSSTPTIRWLQRAAAWSLDPDGADVDGLIDLAGHLEEIASGGEVELPRDLDLQTLLYGAFRPVGSSDVTLKEWLLKVEQALELTHRLRAAGCFPDDVDDVNDLIARAGRVRGDASLISLQDFAAGGRVEGKVTVTTYHGSKGREFDVVILPGLQESWMPRGRWRPAVRQYVPDDLAEERRLFYVAITRARWRVYLLTSDDVRNRFGYPLPESRFVEEVAARFTGEAG